MNAIEWGEKGVNYDVVDGKAVKPMTQGEYIPHFWVGNQLLGYVEVNQDNNLKEIYPQMIDKAKVSKASGFRFSGKGIEKKLEKVVELDSLVYSGSDEEVIKNMEQIVEKYKQAGIDKVIAEWNRQFSEWEKNKK